MLVPLVARPATTSFPSAWVGHAVRSVGGTEEVERQASSVAEAGVERAVGEIARDPEV